MVALKVPTTTLVVKINALTNSLRDGVLFSSLAKKLVTIFDELLRRAEKYVTLEKVSKAKRIKTKFASQERKRESEVKRSSSKFSQRTRLESKGRFDGNESRGRLEGPRGRFKKHTPLKLEPAKMFEVVGDLLEIKFTWSKTRGLSNLSQTNFVAFTMTMGMI